jgi:hypothetical protein
VHGGNVHATQAPALLQLEPAAHVPHVTLSPQPSDAVPQVFAPQGLAAGTQQASLWQVSPDGQVSGQVMVPPQLSEAVPHARLLHAWAGVSGRQQVFLSQLSAAAQMSVQVMVPPHPFGTVPHAMPAQAWVVVIGVQQVVPSHTAGDVQVLGHFTVPPQPSGAVPQATPLHAVAGARGVQQLPALHSSPTPHVPHVTVAPHASFTVPHVTFIS